jgi:hypothetical protein
MVLGVCGVLLSARGLSQNQGSKETRLIDSIHQLPQPRCQMTRIAAHHGDTLKTLGGRGSISAEN